MIAILLVVSVLSVVRLVQLVRSDGLGVTAPPRSHHHETMHR